MEEIALQVDVVQESHRAWLPTAERELLHKVYITGIDALQPDGAANFEGYLEWIQFWYGAITQFFYVKWDACVRMKSIDGKQIGQLRTASAP